MRVPASGHLFRISAPLALALAACAGADASRPIVERETLPGGRMVVRYAALPRPVVEALVPDLRIGRVEGGGPETFGDVRGIEAGPDGTIYVLDYQASEVRAFAPDGAHRATLTRLGEGPGELRQANGLLFDPDGTLWVQDHGARMLIGLDSERGGERVRHPMIVPGFGYVWDAAMDREGVFRQRWSRRVAGDAPDLTATGVQEGTSMAYVKSFDPRTQAYDSVDLGLQTSRSYRIAIANGQMVVGVPFGASMFAAIDPLGNVWTAGSGSYRVARISPAGDTTLILEVDEPPLPLTAADRDAWAEGMASTFERAPQARRELEALLPQVKPVLSALLTDDEGRLWVGRTPPGDAPPEFDVFDPDGEYLASVRMPEGVVTFHPPVIRRGHLYALVRGDFDVQYVVRAPLPELSR
jgi:hypothetical protein